MIQLFHICEKRSTQKVARHISAPIVADALIFIFHTMRSTIATHARTQTEQQQKTTTQSATTPNNIYITLKHMYNQTQETRKRNNKRNNTNI